VEDKAVQIVEGILTDLKDRRGLRQEWNAIDDEIRQQIVETWSAIVRKILTGYPDVDNGTPMAVSRDWKSDGTGFRDEE